MNIEIIDKWLDEEYGVSYTNLEELHDFYFEKYADHKEEIKELKDRIDKAIEYIETYIDFEDSSKLDTKKELKELLDILKGGNNE